MHSMDDPRRFLPLSPQQFHILLALTDGHLQQRVGQIGFRFTF